MMERFSSLVTKSRPWPLIGRTIFFTSDKNRPTRDEIYFIDFWRENLSMYRIIQITYTLELRFLKNLHETPLYVNRRSFRNIFCSKAMGKGKSFRDEKRTLNLAL